jgi:hypothetical protein
MRESNKKRNHKNNNTKNMNVPSSNCIFNRNFDLTISIHNTKKEITMSQPNPNHTKLEQERSEAATASLKNQTESNYTKDTEEAADRIADNAENAKKEK